jgi:RNA polymerase sigma-70 factor (ECF subfamily)
MAVQTGGTAGPQIALSSAVSGLRAKSMVNTDTRVESALRRNLLLVWRVLRRAGLRPADADDATQDVFWVLARRVNDVPVAAEKSFLVATALRIASERRRSKWYRAVTEPLDIEQHAVPAASPERTLETQRRLAVLDEILDKIDTKEREVFILAAIEEMTKSEIAIALNIPEGTVASRLQRAKSAVTAAVRHRQNQKGRLL